LAEPARSGVASRGLLVLVACARTQRASIREERQQADGCQRVERQHALRIDREHQRQRQRSDGLRDELRLREAAEQRAELAMAEELAGDGSAHDRHHAVAPSVQQRERERDDPDAVNLCEHDERDGEQSERQRPHGQRAQVAAERELRDPPRHLHGSDERRHEHRIARRQSRRREQADHVRGQCGRQERRQRECGREPEKDVGMRGARHGRRVRRVGTCATLPGPGGSIHRCSGTQTKRFSAEYTANTVRQP
jgi:hypothetical protein